MTVFVARWWPVSWVVLFAAMLAGSPSPLTLPGQSVSAIVFGTACGLTAALIAWPHSAVIRHAAVVAATAAMMSRSISVALFTDPVQWTPVVAWTVLAVSFTVEAALSWWVSTAAVYGRPLRCP